MNILILSTHLNAGGISRYIINLARGLKARGNNVWVSSSGGEWVEKLSTLGVGHIFIPIRTKAILSPKIIASFVVLKPFLIKENIQVVHCNTRVSQFLGYIIFKFLRIPYISAYHGFYRPSIFRKLFKLSGIKTIAVSFAVKKHLVRDLMVAEEKINVVNNGLSAADFSQKKKTKVDFGFKENDTLIGILGRISEEKGHFLAVEAIQKMITQHNNLYLLISGRGKREADLKRYLRLKAMEGHVRFINAEPSDFLDIIDILIFPSKKEGFGYSIVEAFAKGVCVIGFNVGGIAEIIRDKENGILFYVYESDFLKKAIEELMQDEALRKKIIEGGRRAVLRYSIENMAMATEEVYREVI